MKKVQSINQHVCLLSGALTLQHARICLAISVLLEHFARYRSLSKVRIANVNGGSGGRTMLVGVTTLSSVIRTSNVSCNRTTKGFNDRIYVAARLIASRKAKYTRIVSMLEVLSII